MSEHFAPLLLPFFPSRAVRRLQSGPHWFFSFCILAAVAVVLEVATHARDVSATIAHLPPSATAAEREVVRTDLDAQLPFRAAMLPLEHLAAWSVRAGLLALLLAAFGTGVPPRWKHLMGIAVGSGVIDVAEKLCEAVYAGVAGPGTTAAVPLSLLALTGPPESYPVGLLLSSVNMCTLWHVGIVGWSLSVLCSVRVYKAVVIAGTVWAVSTAGSIVLLHLLRIAYAFTP